MLRMLVNALKSALDGLWWAFGWGLWAISLPLRAFSPPAGNSPIPHAPPATSQAVSAIKPDALFTPSSPRTAPAVVNWCASRLRFGAQATPPAEMIPAEIRCWMLNLREVEMRALLTAGLPRVTAHVTGRTTIDGVLPIRPGPGYRDMDANRRHTVVTLEPAAETTGYRL